MTITVNGNSYSFDGDPRTSLLDFLRTDCGLTGTKKGCDHGQCGACTVLVNGQRINSCLTLAAMHDTDDGGDAITTVEGLGDPASLSDLQAAFVKHDAYQCGYCTPGQICSATALIEEAKAGWPSFVSEDMENPGNTLSDDEIRERMSGNLCRCGAYANILAAIREVAGEAA
ncbi:2Fe-2S iron-sulfur cluster-binding protein [Aurantiacibacter spongiae]|uniref:(2Fe-2S)-binding protein n=1 Tax=Aurantiacibacter spongiae TaxID=2488860 RepID=A0A3N5CUU6_9SPHN|nr:2Fe-2S iron-sulfur cluster-binding protein [Aurantiacibacter spongiae]RPF72507.1 (2Fe-2S)-binding protein [Aurantiacibacter spongiae]